VDPSTLVSPKNFALAASILVVISFARNIAPALFSKRWMQRVLPVLPLLLSSAAFAFGFGDAGETPTWQDKLIAALLTGAASSSIYKFGRTTVLGRGMTAEIPMALPEDQGTPATQTPPPAGEA